MELEIKKMKTRLLITCIVVLSLIIIPQAFAIGSPPPERVPASAYHIVDLAGNSSDVTNVGKQITFSADLTNAQDKDQFVIYVVEIYDYKGVKLHSGSIEGTLAPQMSFSPAVSWIPEKTGYYSVKFKILEDLETQSALSPNIDAEFHVIREGLDTTKTRQWLYPDRECPEGKQVATKYDKSKNVCVFPTTLQKLVERGWGIMPEQSISETPKPIISEAIDTTKIVNANNQFAIDFYSQVTADKQENVFFSPWSISTAFAIAYEGARGNTADEMSDAFGFPKDEEERRTAFAAIHEDLNQKDARYKLNIANALWLAPDFEPFQEYVNTAKTYYDSEVETVNLVGDGIDIINDWVKTKTEDKIEEILVPGSLTAQTRMVITNAIYFNGTWVMPFEEDRTSEQDFIVNAKKTVTVPMMSQTLFFNYTKNDQLFILELPYEGDRLSMLILLPNEIDGITSLEESLTAEKISEWKNDLFERKLQVQMPKFTMETDYDLIPGLKNLGINDAFGPADFSGISNSGLYITKAIHKAFVDVNEKGTEAAAATAIVMDESAPPTFRADHPFIFIIQDNETGIILFIGKVVDPTA